MSTRLGLTFACFDDFTARLDVATSDRQIILEEVYHRLTTDSVLGDGEAADNFGFNVANRLGARMTDEDVTSLGPLLSSVLQRSGRLDSADVVVTRASSAIGLLTLMIDVTVTTPTATVFSFLFKLTGSTFEQVGAT